MTNFILGLLAAFIVYILCAVSYGLGRKAGYKEANDSWLRGNKGKM